MCNEESDNLAITADHQIRFEVGLAIRDGTEAHSASPKHRCSAKEDVTNPGVTKRTWGGGSKVSSVCPRWAAAAFVVMEGGAMTWVVLGPTSSSIVAPACSALEHTPLLEQMFPLGVWVLGLGFLRALKDQDF